MLKGVIPAFFKGLARAAAHPGLILLKWLPTALLALIIAHPYARLLQEDLGDTLLAEGMNGAMTESYWREFSYRLADRIDAMAVHVPVLVLLFVLLHIYLSGGILSRLQDQPKQPFLATCRRNFWPLLGTTALSAVLFVLMVPLPLALLATLIQKWSDWSTPVLFYLWWGGFFFTVIFMFSMVVRIYDYARLSVCRGEGPVGIAGVTSAFWRSMVFNRKHHVATFAILVLFFLLHPLVIWLHQIVLGMAPQSGNLFFIELGIAQLLALARTAASLAAMGGQAAFLEQHLSEEAPPEKVETESTLPAETERTHYAIFQDEDDLDDEPPLNWEPQEPERKSVFSQSHDAEKKSENGDEGEDGELKKEP